MKVHTGFYGMTRRDDQDPFVIGTSTLGGTDKLIY